MKNDKKKGSCHLRAGCFLFFLDYNSKDSTQDVLFIFHCAQTGNQLNPNPDLKRLKWKNGHIYEQKKICSLTEMSTLVSSCRNTHQEHRPT